MKRRTRRSNRRNNPLVPKPIVTMIRSSLVVPAGNQSLNKTYTSFQLVGGDFKARSWHPTGYRLRFNPLGELPDDAMVIVLAVDAASGNQVPISAAKPLSQTTNTYINVKVPPGTCRGWHNTEDNTNNVLALNFINNGSVNPYTVSYIVETHGMMAVDGGVPLTIPS